MNLLLVIFVIYQINYYLIISKIPYKPLSATISYSTPISIFHEISKKKSMYIYIYIFFIVTKRDIHLEF